MFLNALTLDGFPMEIKTEIRYLILTPYYEISYFGFNFDRKLNVELIRWPLKNNSSNPKKNVTLQRVKWIKGYKICIHNPSCIFFIFHAQFMVPHNLIYLCWVQQFQHFSRNFSTNYKIHTHVQLNQLECYHQSKLLRSHPCRISRYKQSKDRIVTMRNLV